MTKPMIGILLFATSSAATAASTDFAIRVAPGGSDGVPVVAATPANLTSVMTSNAGMSLSAAVAVVSRLGRITSTRRSPSRNRAVGGAPNSYHLAGRAIDIVPRSGVRHADIDAALRRAGFSLVESLDEGDHSHFAFGHGRPAMMRSAPAQDPRREVTQWRMVSAPRYASR